MAKIEQLPSGSFRYRVTKTINGKKTTKSFIVSLDEAGGNPKKAKALARSKGENWLLDTTAAVGNGHTVGTAIEDYIRDREKVLSPASIATYLQYVQYFDTIKDIYVQDVDSQMIQRLINDMAIDVSAKTIRSRIGFLLSALYYVGYDRKIKLRYPQKRPSERTAPDTNEVYALINEADDTIKPAICLAAFGTLRRGEICALKQKDISRDMNTVTVHADMVRTPQNTFVYKDMPKTFGSYRTVQLPKEVIRLLPESDDPEAFLFTCTPTAISRRFERLRNRLGYKCSFHDLRHFAASFRSDIGIPRKYIEEAGGWANDSGVLASVYDNTLSSSRKKYVAMTNQYIEETFSDVIRKKQKDA